MIEFEIQLGDSRRIIVLQTSTIGRFTASGTDGTSIILSDGTELLARVPYATFRDAVNTVRNQFISLVPATTA